MLGKPEYTALLKRLYNKPRLDFMMLKDSFFLARVQKKPAGGEDIAQPIVYGTVQNRSASAQKSFQKRDHSKQKRFILDTKKNFQTAHIEHETLLRSMNNAGSFRNALTHEIQLATAGLKNDIHLNLFLKSDGIIGKVKAVVADADGLGNTKIQLSSAADVVYFEVGMTIVDYATEAKSANVIKLDYENAAILVTPGAGSFTADDMLVVDGDKDNKMTGLSEWLPFGSGREAALNTVFNNIDRSVDTARLGGVYVDAQSKDISQGLREASARCALYGLGQPDICLMNHLDGYILENEVESLAVADKINVKSGEITLGFNAIHIGTQAGTAKIVYSSGVPRGVAFMLKMDTWTFWHLGKSYMNTWNEDGLQVIRGEADEGLHARMYSYGNLGCSSPGANGVVFFGVRDDV